MIERVIRLFALVWYTLALVIRRKRAIPSTGSILEIPAWCMFPSIQQSRLLEEKYHFIPLPLALFIFNHFLLESPILTKSGFKPCMNKHTLPVLKGVSKGNQSFTLCKWGDPERVKIDIPFHCSTVCSLSSIVWSYVIGAGCEKNLITSHYLKCVFELNS